MRRGFTLIELLVVVGIIAILATIGMMNFLEAQTRSKVSRVRSDMRTFATAVELYYTDENNYVDTYGIRKLTTPVAYISTITHDVFAERDGSPYLGYVNTAQMSTSEELESWDVSSYTPLQQGAFAQHAWIIWSCGPDIKSTALDNRQRSFNTVVNASGADYGLFYDATNGTVSEGDLIRAPRFAR